MIGGLSSKYLQQVLCRALPPAPDDPGEEFSTWRVTPGLLMVINTNITPEAPPAPSLKVPGAQSQSGQRNPHHHGWIFSNFTFLMARA